MATKKTDLAPTEQPGALAIPEWMQAHVGDLTGTENIKSDELRPPRLALAQPQSPQLIEGDPAYIDTLKSGDAFNDLTGEVYGKGMIEVLIIRADAPRHVIFDEDRKVVEANVPADDPRTQWTEDKDGESVKPEATKFFDYVVVKLPERQPMALSFKSSGLKMAVKLRSLIKSQPLPVFAIRYGLTPVPMKNDQGNWTSWAVKQLGFVQDKELFDFARKCHDSWKQSKVAYDTEHPDREPGSDDGPAPKDVPEGM